MKFEIAKIVRPVELADYAEEYGDRVIMVWVNPPVRLLEEHDQVVNRVREVVSAALKGPTPRPSQLPDGEGEEKNPPYPPSKGGQEV
jgi:hypothetical protein